MVLTGRFLVPTSVCTWYLWGYDPGTYAVPGTCLIFQRRAMMSYWSERWWAICILLRISKLLIVFFLFVLCYCEINWSNIYSFFFVFLLFLNNTEATLVLISMGRGGSVLHHRGVFVFGSVISISNGSKWTPSAQGTRCIIIIAGNNCVLETGRDFLSVGHYVAVTLGDFGSISNRFCPVWTEPLCFGNDFVFISNKPSANVWPSCFNSLNTLRGSVYKLQRHRLNSGWHLYYLSFSSLSLCFILFCHCPLEVKMFVFKSAEQKFNSY